MKPTNSYMHADRDVRCVMFDLQGYEHICEFGVVAHKYTLRAQ